MSNTPNVLTKEHPEASPLSVGEARQEEIRTLGFYDSDPLLANAKRITDLLNAHPELGLGRYDKARQRQAAAKARDAMKDANPWGTPSSASLAGASEEPPRIHPVLARVEGLNRVTMERPDAMRQTSLPTAANDALTLVSPRVAFDALSDEQTPSMTDADEEPEMLEEDTAVEVTADGIEPPNDRTLERTEATTFQTPPTTSTAPTLTLARTEQGATSVAEAEAGTKGDEQTPPQRPRLPRLSLGSAGIHPHTALFEPPQQFYEAARGMRTLPVSARRQVDLTLAQLDQIRYLFPMVTSENVLVTMMALAWHELRNLSPSRTETYLMALNQAGLHKFFNRLTLCTEKVARRGLARSRSAALTDEARATSLENAMFPSILRTVATQLRATSWDAIHDGHLITQKMAYHYGIIRYARSLSTGFFKRLNRVFRQGDPMGFSALGLWEARTPLIIAERLTPSVLKLVVEAWIQDPHVGLVLFQEPAGRNILPMQFGIPTLVDREGRFASLLALDTTKLPALLEHRLGGITLTHATGFIHLPLGERLPPVLPWVRTLAEIAYNQSMLAKIASGKASGMSEFERLRWVNTFERLIEAPVQDHGRRPEVRHEHPLAGEILREYHAQRQSTLEALRTWAHEGRALNAEESAYLAELDDYRERCQAAIKAGRPLPRRPKTLAERLFDRDVARLARDERANATPIKVTTRKANGEETKRLIHRGSNQPSAVRAGKEESAEMNVEMSVDVDVDAKADANVMMAPPPGHVANRDTHGATGAGQEKTTALPQENAPVKEPLKELSGTLGTLGTVAMAVSSATASEPAPRMAANEGANEQADQGAEKSVNQTADGKPDKQTDKTTDNKADDKAVSSHRQASNEGKREDTRTVASTPSSPSSPSQPTPPTPAQHAHWLDVRLEAAKRQREAQEEADLAKLLAGIPIVNESDPYADLRHYKEGLLRRAEARGLTVSPEALAVLWAPIPVERLEALRAKAHALAHTLAPAAPIDDGLAGMGLTANDLPTTPTAPGEPTPSVATPVTALGEKSSITPLHPLFQPGRHPRDDIAFGETVPVSAARRQKGKAGKTKRGATDALPVTPETNEDTSEPIVLQTHFAVYEDDEEAEATTPVAMSESTGAPTPTGSTVSVADEPDREDVTPLTSEGVPFASEAFAMEESLPDDAPAPSKGIPTKTSQRQATTVTTGTSITTKMRSVSNKANHKARHNANDKASEKATVSKRPVVTSTDTDENPYGDLADFLED